MKSLPEQKQALAILAQGKLRRTEGRLRLLEALLRVDHPQTHQELMDGSGLSGVALYRALDSFREAGIVHRIDNGDRVWRFAVCECHHSIHCHPHFTCRVCGEVECLNEVSLAQVAIALPGYAIEEQEVYLRGVCARCK